MTTAELHCHCLDFSESLPALLDAYTNEPNTLIICSSTILKDTVLDVIPKQTEVLTYKELLYLNASYPPQIQEALEKKAIRNSIQTHGYLDLDETITLSAPFCDQLLQLFKYTQQTGQALPKRLQPLYDDYCTHCPHASHLNDWYWTATSAFLKDKQLVVLGFYEWSQQDNAFFKQCRDYCSELHVLLAYDPLTTNTKSAEQLYHTLAKEEAIVHVTPFSREQDPPISLYKASSPTDECQFVLQSIAAQIDSGIAPKDIAIILPNFHQDKHQLETIAKTLHIPVQSSVGYTLANHPIAVFIHHLFVLIMSDFDINDITQFLKAPFTRSYNVDSETRLILSKDPDTIQTLENELSGLKQCKSFTMFKTMLKTIITKFGVADTIHHALNDSQSEFNPLFSGYHAFLTVLDELEIYAKNTSSIHHYIDDILMCLENVQYPALIAQTNAIQILSKKEAFLCQKEHVYIMGFLDGRWPEDTLNTPFLNDIERQDAGLPGASYFYDLHHYLFYYLQRHSSNITISYPKKVADQDTVPSHFLNFCEALQPISTYNVCRYSAKEQQIQNSGAIQAQKLAQVASLEQQRTLSPNSSYWGGISQLKLKERLHDVFKTHLFSPTQLETYQKCPHQYFFSKLLKLPDNAVRRDTIPPDEWGKFVHQLLADLHEKDITITNDTLKAHAETAIQTIAMPAFAKQLLRHKLFGLKQVSGLLDWYLLDHHNAPYTLTPLNTEQYFGGTDTPLELKNDSDTLHLHGQIDLVLTDPQKQELIVLDYKTGSYIPSGTEITNFEHLQLPIYLYAATTLYPKHRAAGAMIHQLHDQNKHGHHVLLCREDAKKDIFDLGRKRPPLLDDSYFHHLNRHLLQIKGHIMAGRFSMLDAQIMPRLAKKRPEFCGNCSYRQICRYPDRFRGRK